MPIQCDYYRNEATQRERREQLANERAVQRDEASTLHQRAQQTLGDELGGRFKQHANASIVGTPTYSVPRLPASSPWAQPDPNGPEPPFGLDMTTAPDIGYPFDSPAASLSMGDAVSAVPSGPQAADTDPLPTPSARMADGGPGADVEPATAPSAPLSIKPIRRV